MTGWRVLVMDDQPEITANLKKQLIHYGFEPRVAQKVTEADFLIRHHDFDIAILDIMLPDGNGIDVFRNLRKKNPDVYTIMITGNATIENAITALNEGVNAYLIKPFAKEQLKATLLQAEKMLNLKAENEALFNKVRSNQQMYENLLNSSSEAILVTDLDFCIQYSNQAALKLLNTGRNTLDKQLLHEYIDDGFKVMSHIYQQLVLGRSVAGYRVGIKSAGAKSIDAHLTADFFYNENRHIEGLIVNLSNTMIHDELFGRMLRKEKLATIINLANALGHEIRNPINILYGRLQLLAEELDDENFTHAYQSIGRQIDRLLNITGLLSKFNFSREDSIPEQFSLIDNLKMVIDEKRPAFKEKQIRVTTHFESESNKVEGNRAQFTDAFRYLLDALHEFTPNRRVLKMRAKNSNGYTSPPWIELQFVLPDIQLSTEQLFDPYASEDIKANSLVGLGMIIMYTIFTNYRAKIDSHIVDKKNTLIRIRFPSQAETAKKESKPAKKQKSKTTKSKRGGIL